MKGAIKTSVVLLFAAIAIFFISGMVKAESPSVASGRTPGHAKIELEQLDFYQPNWSAMKDVVDSLLAIGYMNIQINDFDYHYYCFHNEDLSHQSSDPLVLEPGNLDPIHAWCKRNKGKFSKVSFWGSVEFDVVTEVVKILNSHGIKFHFSVDANRSEQIKLDLLVRDAGSAREEGSEKGSARDL